MIKQKSSQPAKANNPNAGQNDRMWRVESTASEDFVDEGHGWAISYSDLLMVLMSFFIIFFSFTDEKREDGLKNIAIQIRKDSVVESKGSVAGGTSKQNSVTSQTAPAKDKQSAGVQSAAELGEVLTSSLKGANTSVKKEIDPNTLTVSFEEGLFQLRSYEVAPNLREKLDELFEVLLPNQENIKIFFVGHTDSKALRILDQGPITNNFVLSSLRASSALNYAIEKGFHPKNLFAQGSADNDITYRSVSIRVVMATSTDKLSH